MPATESELRAASLAAARRRIFLLGSAIGLGLPALLWASGPARATWAALADLPAGLAASVFVLAFWIAMALATAPCAFYRGYVLQRRYGLARQSARGWLVDWLKASALGLGLATLASLAFYWTVWSFGAHWWWTFGGLAVAASVALTYVAPYVVLPIFFRPRPLERPEIVVAVKRLVDAAGTRVAAICSLDFSRRTAEANAAVIGVGKSRRVVLADTLLDGFTLPEIRAVVAHELGHHVHGDVPRLLALQALIVLATLFAASRLAEPALSWVGASGSLGEVADFPLLAAVIEGWALALMPVLNAFSRAIEASADRYAIYLTGDPVALAAALRRLASQNLAELSPPRWAELLLYSHPPISQRIRLAEQASGRTPSLSPCGPSGRGQGEGVSSHA
ncbi:MAG TPA: M48 family metalloprotease [Chloroflexota bacterium]|nr:M48 family metalloprotease [Chloroflexota bacterium]